MAELMDVVVAGGRPGSFPGGSNPGSCTTSAAAITAGEHKDAKFSCFTKLPAIPRMYRLCFELGCLGALGGSYFAVSEKFGDSSLNLGVSRLLEIHILLLPYSRKFNIFSILPMNVVIPILLAWSLCFADIEKFEMFVISSPNYCFS